jgi:long-chain-fatty-acid--CoA ligase ACSBG
MGSILGFYMPVGVYTTNGAEACHYVAEHSDAEVIVVENNTHLDKYLAVKIKKKNKLNKIINFL